MEQQKKMLQELDHKKIFDQVQGYALEYLSKVDSMDAFPQNVNIEKLSAFDEVLPSNSCSADEVLHQLHAFGSPATVAQNGGRYFGFVNGSSLPVGIATKWLSAAWDQNGGLYYTSPINAMLELVCENWLKEIFKLPDSTVAGFVSGTSTANLCALLAARYELLRRQDWDVNKQGLNGAPMIRIIAHDQVHSSVKKTLSLIGFGQNTIEWLPSNFQGKLMADELPNLDENCLLLLQAGNANTGAFDDFESICVKAQKAAAWVHIDGAFGLWAAASKKLSHLTKGIEKADSWAVDGHKTLNTPYDSGIVLCKNADAMITALQASGEYIIYSDKKDPMLYSTEMSKSSRAIELWACMKYLGRKGIDELVSQLHSTALEIAKQLNDLGLTIINEVVFNQVLVQANSQDKTKHLTQYLQKSGSIWLGGTTWKGEAAIRISCCSWKTNTADIKILVDLFQKGLSQYKMS